MELFRVYVKFLWLRGVIRREMKNVLCMFVSFEYNTTTAVPRGLHQAHYSNNNNNTNNNSSSTLSTSSALIHQHCGCCCSNGIAELLDIWGSIISGFSVPLKMVYHTVLLALSC
jgi:hypothetical protein